MTKIYAQVKLCHILSLSLSLSLSFCVNSLSPEGVTGWADVGSCTDVLFMFTPSLSVHGSPEWPLLIVWVHIFPMSQSAQVYISPPGNKFAFTAFTMSSPEERHLLDLTMYVAHGITFVSFRKMNDFWRIMWHWRLK